MKKYKISEDEALRVLVKNVNDRPNALASYGIAKKTPTDTKDIFDKQFRLVQEKHNLLADEMDAREETNEIKLKRVQETAEGAAGAVESAVKAAGAAASAAERVEENLSAHVVSDVAHSDIRILISELTARLNAVANSSDTDLDQLSEIVAYIKANKELIESVTTSKVSVSDIVDNLTTNMGDRPLSARMGVELKRLIDNIEAPESNLPDWVKQPNPPTYTKDDVGLGNVDNARQYSAQNPPPYPVTSVNGKGGDVIIDETDPTVPAWAKQPTRPEYTNSDVGLGNVANERQYSEKNPPPYPVVSVNGQSGEVILGAGDVGALPADTKIPKKTSEITNDSGFIKANEAPVQSVNGKSGAVTLAAGDVGARPNTWTPTYSEVGAEKSGAAASAVSSHNTNTDAHNDIRLLIAGLAERLNALANSTDEDLDQMAEIVAYIKANKNLIDQITTGKVNYTDIVNDLATNVANKPLSAAQGVALKALIDAIVVPTKVSQLTNDSKFLTAIPDEYVTETELAAKKYLTSYTETDPTVPSWAKATSKPSYTKSEVGLGNVDNVKQYSPSNPPPYPVTSVNAKTGDVTITVPTKVSELTNDSKYLTSIPSNYVTDAKAETWTFTLKSGSTVTKKVVLA